MAYPHKRHRFQKFIVFLFAIVIILLVSYFVALPKIKTKATGIVAENFWSHKSHLIHLPLQASMPKKSLMP